MHIVLTDLLACPRCGPDFGLVLLADRIEERRVLEGTLGCSNCRDGYPVRNGRADLRTRLPEPGTEPAPSGSSAEPVRADPAELPAAPSDAPAPSWWDGPVEQSALRLAALLGVTEGPAAVLLLDPPAGAAGAISDTVAELEVIYARVGVADEDGEGGEGPASSGGVSPMLVGERLPFAANGLAAVGVCAPVSGALLEEAVRVLRPGCRLAHVAPTPEVVERFEGLGCEVVVRNEEAVVARKTGSPDPPKLYQLL